MAFRLFYKLFLLGFTDMLERTEMQKAGSARLPALLCDTGLISWLRLFHSFFDRDRYRDGGSDHRVVAHADEAHHVDVRWDG